MDEDFICPSCHHSPCKCMARKLDRDDDRRRAKKHRSEFEHEPPSWDDVIRAMEEDQ